MKRRLLSLALLAACPAPSQGTTTPPTTAEPATPAPATPPVQSWATARQLTADTELPAPGGATVTGPAGWTAMTMPGYIALASPEQEVTLWFVARAEADGAAAIAAAWRQVQPTFARAVRLTTTPPGRDGWDAVVNVTYETTTAELRRVWATARRKGDTWHVTLFDGTLAGWGRRFPQATIAEKSLKAPGVARASFAGKTAHKLDAARLAALRAFVADAQQRLQIPGVAVAVVQGGAVVFAEGFGVRKLGERAPVTADTLFRVASMSKPLTSLLMARLVDEGAFTWDTPAVTVLPSFALGDPETTKRLTMRHTVCACTGLPRQDLETIFDGAGHTPERMLAGMAAMKPTTRFGETYQYSNPLVAAGGYLAAHAVRPRQPLGDAFRAVMAEKIFKPLAMKRTTYDTATAARGEFAAPHAATAALVTTPISLADDAWVDVWQPTGGAWSSAREYAQYLLLELADGKAGGKQVVSAANLRERRKPQVRRSDTGSYGLGLAMDDLGVEVYSHSGGLGGYSSHMFFLPDHGVGAVVLTNLGDAAAWHAPVRRKLLELLFDARPEADEDLAFAVDARRAERAKEAARIDPSPDPAWLQPYVGEWHNPQLGAVHIRLDAGKAVLDAGEWRSAVGRKTEDDGVQKLVLTTPPWRYELVPGEADGAATLTLDVPQQRYVFTRAAGPRG